jgi:sugar transferase (PEP-CTERM/EpsH1 system associated)
MKKINVLHLLLNLECGGMESGVVNLINNINQDQFSSYICCLENSGALRERLSEEKGKIFELHKEPGRSLRIISALRKIYCNYEIDVVHTHNYATLAYGGVACLFSKKPYLVHGEHGDLPLQLKNPKYVVVRKVMSLKAAMFHAVSEDLRNLFMEKVGIPANKIKHIANGLDLDKFKPCDSRALRYEYGFQEKDFIILGIGSFYPWKNFTLLIEAADILKAKNLGFKLILAGSGPESEKLKKLVLQKGLERWVHFLGYRKDTPEIINISNCLVQPSLTEGMSNTIMEAFACAKPVIASRVGGNSELVNDGVSGYLFSSSNVYDLVEKIILIYEDMEKAKKMGVEARKLSEERFSLKRMVKEYEELYLAVANSNHSNH